MDASSLLCTMIGVRKDAAGWRLCAVMRVSRNEMTEKYQGRQENIDKIEILL